MFSASANTKSNPNWALKIRNILAHIRGPPGWNTCFRAGYLMRRTGFFSIFPHQVPNFSCGHRMVANSNWSCRVPISSLGRGLTFYNCLLRVKTLLSRRLQENSLHFSLMQTGLGISTNNLQQGRWN